MSEYIKIYKFKKLISLIMNSRGNGTSVITLLIPPGSSINTTKKMLNNELGTAKNIKSHNNQLKVLSAINTCLDLIKPLHKTPRNGLVICVGEIVDENGKNSKKSWMFEPIKELNKSLYRCDNKFHLEGLSYMLQDDKIYGLIVVDGNGTVFGKITSNSSEIVHKITVDLPKKMSKGGQSAGRFGRLRLEKRQNYLTKVAEKAVQIYISNDTPNVTGIILAGSSNFKYDLEKYQKFDQRLKKIIVHIVTVSYGGEMGFKEAITKSKDQISNLKLVREQKLLANYFEEIAKDTGNICYGIAETMYALECGAVKTLILYDKLPVRRLEINVSNQENIKYIYNNSQINDDWEILSNNLLIDWLIENNENSATIELISDATSQGTQFSEGFGGIGAKLHYALDCSHVNFDDYGNDSDDDDFAL